MKVQHVKRYTEIARLLWKYGRSDALTRFPGVDLEAEAMLKDDQTSLPDELAADLEAMGPTFIKLGQILSSRADLLPEPYLRALAKLQDKVAPFTYAEVEEIVQTELGVRISKAFHSFESEPLAAASLGQVHRATLREGRAVVVKVQRPHIRKVIAQDMEVLLELATFLEAHTTRGKQFGLIRLVEQFQCTILEELDYQREALNLKTLGHNLRAFPKIRVPQPIDGYTSRSVLTMEYIDGRKVTELAPVARMDMDGIALADELFNAYLTQVLVDGLFHADPHPGNVFLTEDLHIALLDLGMVGRISPVMQDQILKLLMAVSEGRSDEAAGIAIEMGNSTAAFEEKVFRQRVGVLITEQRGTTLEKLDLGRTLLEVGRQAGTCGLLVPPEVVMLGKTLLQLQEIGRHLNPDFDPNSAIRRHLTGIVNRRWSKDLTPANFLSILAEAKDFVRYLPSKLSKALDTLTKPTLEIRVRPEDTKLLLEGLQKIANRIAAGLVLAALIVGAALLMSVRTQFQLFGYPGFAILCFIVAAGGGFWMLLNTVLADRRSRRKVPRS